MILEKFPQIIDIFQQKGSTKILYRPILQTMNTTDISDKGKQSKCKVISFIML